jgi:hypothetical protein
MPKSMQLRQREKAEKSAARSRYEPAELNRIGFRLYEKFRPDVPYGNEGCGKRAILDVEMIRVAT